MKTHCCLSLNRHAAGMQRRPAAGFTTLELLITITIACILAAIALPSFTNLVASQSAKAAASDLFSSLVRTRSEATTRNANVTLSPIAGTWQNGWQILDPANAANILDTRNKTSGVTISGPSSVIYNTSGRIQGSVAPLFVITAMVGSTPIYQCVSVDLSGRPYMKATSSC
jgi:type IV fimbrial biogenesis protein FimT